MPVYAPITSTNASYHHLVPIMPLSPQLAIGKMRAFELLDTFTFRSSSSIFNFHFEFWFGISVYFIYTFNMIQIPSPERVNRSVYFIASWYYESSIIIL